MASVVPMNCPVHQVVMVLTRYDDGDVSGIQHWDDKYTCPVEGCDQSEWDSWEEPSSEATDERA
jgi:hypothetical protein